MSWGGAKGLDDMQNVPVSHWSSRIPTGHSWWSCCRVKWEGAWTDDSASWTRRWHCCCWEAQLSWLLVLWWHNWADCLCCDGTTELTACALKAQPCCLLVLWRHNWADCLCYDGTTELTACAMMAQLSWLLVLWRHNWADCLCSEGTTQLTACAVMAQLSWLTVLWRHNWADCLCYEGTTQLTACAVREGLHCQMTWISHFFWGPAFFESVPETCADDGSCHSTIQGAALTCTRRHSSADHFPLSQSCVSSIILSILFSHIDKSEPAILMLSKQI